MKKRERRIQCKKMLVPGSKMRSTLMTNIKTKKTDLRKIINTLTQRLPTKSTYKSPRNQKAMMVTKYNPSKIHQCSMSSSV